jgi:hypothetical protein
MQPKLVRIYRRPVVAVEKEAFEHYLPRPFDSFVDLL